jgi:hypothetical protein
MNKRWEEIQDSLIGFNKLDIEDLVKARFLHEINERQEIGAIHHMTLMMMVKIFPSDFVLQEILSESTYRIGNSADSDEFYSKYLFANQPDEPMDYGQYLTKFDLYKKDYVNRLIKKFPEKKNIIMDWIYH